MEKQVYMVSDIIDILGISKSKAYDFIRDAYKNGNSFRVIKIAGTYRIPKKVLTSGFKVRNFETHN